jgi:hypothetical protein
MPIAGGPPQKKSKKLLTALIDKRNIRRWSEVE